MNKIASTEYSVIDILKKRWSPRSFSDKVLSDTDIKTVLEAASWAPSAFNAQPWRYFYALKDTNGFNQLLDCLTPFNQVWVKNAAALLLCIGNKFYNGKENPTYAHDCGLANVNMLTQATAMGFYGHIMSGFSIDKTISLLNLDENVVTPLCFIALGYLGSADQLDSALKDREEQARTRKSVSEISLNFG